MRAFLIYLVLINSFTAFAEDPKFSWYKCNRIQLEPSPNWRSDNVGTFVVTASPDLGLINSVELDGNKLYIRGSGDEPAYNYLFDPSRAKETFALEFLPRSYSGENITGAFGFYVYQPLKMENGREFLGVTPDFRTSVYNCKAL